MNTFPPAPQRAIYRPIPAVTCPQCGASMRLSRVDPPGQTYGERMFFECICGFGYALSERAD